MNTRKLSATDLIDLSRRASFVFSGRVKALGKHNLTALESDERMALVRVDDVVVAPPALGDLTGKTVTVYLLSPRGLESNDLVMFFAAGWQYGRNIGVTELGRTSTPAKELRQRVIDARLEGHHAQLEARIRRAVLVISGRVLTTFRSDQKDLPGRDEGIEWWEAEMWVGTVEKGVPPQQLRMFYPVGGDREWGPVPKAHPGQVGVWLLGPVSEPDSEDGSETRRETRAQKAQQKDRAQRLMALDPLDYQAISALPHVQELLRRTGQR